MFWHALWVQAGRPGPKDRCGGLFKVMRHARYKYHQAVKLGKREASRIEAECLAEAAYYGNADLFKEMKRHLDRRTSGQEFPHTFEGKVTPNDILEEFRKCYSSLYNSTSSTEEMNILKDKLAAHILRF